MQYTKNSYRNLLFSFYQRIDYFCHSDTPSPLNQSKTYIYTLALLAVTFWGISYVWTKIAFTSYGPITVMFIRLTISSGLMLLIYQFRKHRERIDKKDYKAFILLSFFSPFCYFIGENFGVYHVSPTIAAVFIATIPVFSPLLAYVAFKEKVTLTNMAGFLISFAGILVMVMDGDFRLTASPIGIFWLLFAVLSALINIIFLKKLASRYSSFTIILVQNCLGALFFLPVFLLTDVGQFFQTTPTTAALLSIIALAVFGSTLAFMFYTSSVRAIGIARTAIFSNLIPVVTAITAFLFLGEIIEGWQVMGMGIVISGLLLTQFSHKRRQLQGAKK